MEPPEHLQRARSELVAAKEAARDEELAGMLDNLQQGADLVAPTHRPIQPQSVLRLKLQIDAVVDTSSEPDVTERLERAREHYDAVYQRVQTEYTGL